MKRQPKYMDRIEFWEDEEEIKDHRKNQTNELLKMLVWLQHRSAEYRRNTLLVDAVKDFKLHSTY